MPFFKLFRMRYQKAFLIVLIDHLYVIFIFLYLYDLSRIEKKKHFLQIILSWTVWNLLFNELTEYLLPYTKPHLNTHFNQQVTTFLSSTWRWSLVGIDIKTNHLMSGGISDFSLEQICQFVDDKSQDFLRNFVSENDHYL